MWSWRAHLVSCDGDIPVINDDYSLVWYLSLPIWTNLWNYCQYFYNVLGRMDRMPVHKQFANHMDIASWYKKCIFYCEHKILQDIEDFRLHISCKCVRTKFTQQSRTCWILATDCDNASDFVEPLNFSYNKFDVLVF